MVLAPVLICASACAQGSKGTPTDKLRAALVYLCTCATPPGDSEYADLERAMADSASGADLAALHYVRRLRRMKLTGRTGEWHPFSLSRPVSLHVDMGASLTAHLGCSCRKHIERATLSLLAGCCSGNASIMWGFLEKV